MTFKTVWQTAVDVLHRRGKLVRSDRKRGLLRLEQSPFYPHQGMVDELIRPNQSAPFHQNRTFVEAQVEQITETQVDLSVYAWTEYRAFSRRFDTDHEGTLQQAVFTDILGELAHQRRRQGVATELATTRARATAKVIPGMVFVPAGPFVMGDSQGHPDEGPVHGIDLPAYYIDRFEVTVAEYKKFIRGGGYRNRKHWSEAGWKWRVDYDVSKPKSWSSKLRDNLPVFGVSWFEAQAYARWTGKQLPTEAQWEKAARFTLPSRYPWGNTMIDEVNCLGQSVYGPISVTDFPRNVSIVGCHQMSGNVSEWCRDWYEEDAYRRSNRSTPKNGVYKVLRGGSFFDLADASRVSFRDRCKPGYRAVSFGFRCVREVTP